MTPMPITSIPQALRHQQPQPSSQPDPKTQRLNRIAMTFMVLAVLATICQAYNLALALWVMAIELQIINLERQLLNLKHETQNQQRR